MSEEKGAEESVREQDLAVQLVLQKTYQKYLKQKQLIDQLIDAKSPKQNQCVEMCEKEQATQCANNSDKEKGEGKINCKVIRQIDPLILQPYTYLQQKGGKKIRILMAILLNEMFEPQLRSEVIQIGGLIEYLHCASLIIDDIEDGSQQRRGQDCSHIVYGMDRSINAANLMYFLPFHRLLCNIHNQGQRSQLAKVFFEEMTCCHLGQAEDVVVHRCQSEKELPMLQEYFRMVSAKTGSLMRMLVGMIGVILNISEETTNMLLRTMDYVGISFQITDDILNLTTRMGKGLIAEDLHEKKFTLVIHYLRHNQRFMQLFAYNRKDYKTIEEMLRIVDASNVIDQCKKIAQQYAQKALRLIEQVQCPYQIKSFKTLIGFIVNRHH